MIIRNKWLEINHWFTKLYEFGKLVQRVAMRPDIEERLKEVYASGQFCDRNAKALYGDDYANKIADAVVRAASRTEIRFDGDTASPKNATHHLAFTVTSGLSSQEWCFSCDNETKLMWIREHSSFFPIFWLDVSRVFPAYCFHYNLWKPRGDTGYLDIEISHSPFSPEWAKFHSALFDELDHAGLWCFSEDELKEVVPFVHDGVDYDENGNTLPDDAPPLVIQSCVGACLFPLS